MKPDDIELLAPGVLLYKNIFNSNFLEAFIQSVEHECIDPNGSLYWDQSRVGGSDGIASEYRSSLTCSLDILMAPGAHHPLSQSLKEGLHEPILECALDYANIYELDAGVSEPYNLLKYSAGAHYRSHFDSGPSSPRIFSMVAYLHNTSTGGDLEFQHLKLRVPCEENSVLLFPSSYPYSHYAHPVLDGVKYSLVTWYS